MKLRILYVVFVQLLFITGTAQKTSVTGKEQVSLNGDWKFHTIYGEGSNYLNIQPKEEDIVLDNRDPNVEVFGEWTTKTEAQLASTFYGADYLQHNFTLTEINKGNKADSSHVRFRPRFKKSGFYEVFTQFPFSSHLTTQYNIKHAEGITTKYVSQRTYCGEWISLGIFQFDKNEQNYVELTALVSGAVAADAVMFRELEEQKYKQAKKEPSQVYRKDYDDSDWLTLKVPGHWGMNNTYSNYTGKAWYRNTLKLPLGWHKNKENRYYLKFDGIYHIAKIYLNGTYLGMNRGGFTPFEFDVTEHLDFKGDNIIAVEADNSAIVGATWNWGGIIRDVTLSKNNTVRITSQYLHAEPNLETGEAIIRLRLKLQNTSVRTRKVKISTRLFDNREIGKMNSTVEIPANSSQTFELQTKLTKNQVELWHFDHPKLYDFETEITEDGHLLDTEKEHFGIRKIELTDSKMLLNGEPVRLGGFNRVSESRFWGSAEPEAVLERDVDLMKEAGANFMRIMHGTQNKKLFDICDRKGILLFEEVNVRDLDNDEFRAQYYPLEKFKKETGLTVDPTKEEILTLEEPYIKIRPEHNFKVEENNYFLAKYWLKQMIERDANHPSIIGWSVGNELNNHYGYGKAAIAYVKKELDPYRLVTCVSNSGQKPEYTPQTDPNTFVDIIMHNMYRWQGEPQEILSTLHKKWPGKPIFISEYGFDPFPSTEIDGDKAIFSEWMNHFRHKNEYVIGTSMWTFNDYRSGYAGTTAEENRVWGIVTTWRDKRRLFERIQKEHAPIKDIIVTDIDFTRKTAKVRIPIKSRSNYPSYGMKDYYLNYALLDANGKVAQNKINLPQLDPEAGEWTGTIKWKNVSTLPLLALNLTLVAPTQHTRFAKTISFQKPISPTIKEILAGENSVRIIWDKVPNAKEYLVRYSTNNGKKMTSDNTITNSLDIENLSPNTLYHFQVLSANDKGESEPSASVTASTTNSPLPPMIWDAFITENKMVIGYSSDFKDGNYIVQYGDVPTQLNQQFTTNVRGMLTIDIPKKEELYFRISREHLGKTSIPSQVVKASLRE